MFSGITSMSIAPIVSFKAAPSVCLQKYKQVL